MPVGGCEDRKVGEPPEAACIGRQPQDAVTCNMARPTPSFHRLAFLLALLAAILPATRAPAPPLGLLTPYLDRGPLPYPTPLVPRYGWRSGWRVRSRFSPFPKHRTNFVGPRLRAADPMDRLGIRSDLVGQVLKENVDIALNTDYSRLARPPLPAPPRHKYGRRPRPSRRRNYNQKRITSRRRHIQLYGAVQPNRRLKVKGVEGERFGRKGQSADGVSRRAKNGLESKDVRISVTVPSAVLQPLLPSLPMGKRQGDSDKGFRPVTTPRPAVEIVGVDVKERDTVNTTVVLTLRDHRQEVESEEMENLMKDGQYGVLSRSKRSYRRRMGYGMNGRIRAQMLAHRLSISYRHVKPCSYKDRFYCMNGGTCVNVSVLDIKTCRCPIGYTGVRCELIDQEYILSLLTDSIIFS